jgi:D-glycero-alpha-D-manno-heptose-7-phosphate kinase
MEPICARVPSRIDLGGGTLDIWPLHHAMPEPGITVNVAVDVPAYARVRPDPEGGSAITLVSEDQACEVRYADLDALVAASAARTCPLPLLSEAVRAVHPERGFTLTTEATGPAGAGLGGSSALLGAVLGALLASCGRSVPPRDLQPLAQDVETRLLGKPTGYQDYFPPLLGGCLALEGAVGGLRVEHLPVDLEALGARLQLIYTGAPHVSGITNWGVYRAFFDGEPQTVRALHELAGISRAMAGCLRGSDLDGALDLVLEDGRVRRQMAPGVSTPLIESLDEALRAAGARGTAVCGAGGGGCLLAVLEPGDDRSGLDAVLADSPARALPTRLVAEGLELSPLS